MVCVQYLLNTGIPFVDILCILQINSVSVSSLNADLVRYCAVSQHQSDHLSGKPRAVRKFHSSWGNVEEVTKRQESDREKSDQRKLLITNATFEISGFAWLFSTRQY